MKRLGSAKTLTGDPERGFVVVFDDRSQENSLEVAGLGAQRQFIREKDIEGVLDNKNEPPIPSLLPGVTLH